MENNHKHIILIVDDDKYSTEIAVSILKSINSVNKVVRKGKEALSLLESINPDLILLSIMIPDIDGYEICEKIKNNKKTSHIPIIFISTLDSTFNKVKAFKLGAVDYLTKPYQHEEMLARVNVHLSNSSYRKQLQQKNKELEIMVAERSCDCVAAKEIAEKKSKQLQTVNEISKLGYWELDLVNNKLYWSDQIYAMFKLKPQSIKADYDIFLSFVHPDDREILNKAYTSHLKNKTKYDLIHRVLLKNGDVLYNHVKCKTVYDKNDKPIRSIGTVLDITGIKNVETKLKESKDELEAIFDNAPNAIMLIDEDRNIVKINKSGKSFLIQSNINFLKNRFGKVFNCAFSFNNAGGCGFSDNCKNCVLNNAILLTLETGERVNKTAWNFEQKHKEKTYTTHFNISSSLIKREKGKNVLLILDNVTRNVISEKMILESRLKYKTIADFTFDWEYWINKEKKFEYVSPSCERITGYKPDEFINSPELYENIIHPEDKEMVQSHNHNSLNRKGNCDLIEFRIITKSNKTKWIAHACQPVYDMNNNYIGQRGSNRDVSKRKKIEQKIIEQNLELINKEERYRRLSEATFEGIIYSEGTKIIDSNQQNEYIFGYKIVDFIQLSLTDIFHPDDIKDINSISKREILNCRGIKQNGDIVYLELRAHYTYYFDKKIRLLILRDITEKIKAEKEQKQNEEKLLFLVENLPIPTFVKDENGKYILTNKKFKEYIYQKNSDILGKTDYELFSEELADRHRLEDKRIIKNGIAETFEEVFMFQGEERYSITTKMPFKFQSSECGILGVFIDTTFQRNAQKEILQTIIETEEKERARFAEDLHDGLKTILYGIRMYLSVLDYKNKDITTIKETFKLINDLVSQSISATEEIAENIMPPDIQALGVLKAVELYCLKINKLNEIQIKIENQINNQTFKPKNETLLFRIIQELISNTLKHAEAKNIYLKFEMNNEKFIFTYQDNGKGFDVNSVMKKEVHRFGLRNIQSRVKSMGGDIKIQSSLKGTTFVIEL